MARPCNYAFDVPEHVGIAVGLGDWWMAGNVFRGFRADRRRDGFIGRCRWSILADTDRRREQPEQRRVVSVIPASGLSKDTRLPSDAVNKSRAKSRIEAAMVARSADTYADFLLPHLQPDMVGVDLGCGRATISIGLSETVPNGRVVGVDIDRDDLAMGRRNAAAMDRGNLAFAAADGRRLPFGDHVFDAVLCHSVPG